MEVGKDGEPGKGKPIARTNREKSLLTSLLQVSPVGLAGRDEQDEQALRVVQHGRHEPVEPAASKKQRHLQDAIR